MGKLLILFLSAMMLFVGCEDDATSTPKTGIEGEACRDTDPKCDTDLTCNDSNICEKTVVVVPFSPCFDQDGCNTPYVYPFPSNFMLQYNESGHTLNLPIKADYNANLQGVIGGMNATIDGWSTTLPFTVSMNETIAANSIIVDTKNATVKVYAYDGKTLTQIEIAVAVDNKTISISPQSLVWKEKTTYVVVVTKDIKNSDDENLAQNPDFTRLTGDTALTGDAAQYEADRVRLKPIFDLLESHESLPRDQIAMMYDVTTLTVSDDLAGLRFAGQTWELNTAITQTVPAAGFEALLQSIPDASDFTSKYGYDNISDVYSDIAYVLTGAFDAPSYMNLENDYFDPAKITEPGTENLSFMMTLPKPDANNENCTIMPEDGFPVILFQHGLGGDNKQILILANEMSQHCYAVIGIDAYRHGSRKLDDYPSGAGFFTANPFSSRDHIRQTVLDQTQLYRVIKDLAGANSALLPESVKLDSSKVGYFGISLGGILGTVFSAVEPDITESVLNVPGGVLTRILMESDATAFVKDPVVAQIDQYMGLKEGTPDFDLFIQLNQIILDQADPAAYSYHLTQEPISIQLSADLTFTYPVKNIQIQRAENDHVIPNATTSILADAMGGVPTIEYVMYSGANGEDVEHTFIAFNPDFEATDPNQYASASARDDMFYFYSEKLLK